MRRRGFLKNSLILGLGCASGALAGQAPARRPWNRVRPTDTNWPRAQDWDAFSRDLTGDLIKPAAFLAECIQEPTGATCQETLSHLRNPYYIGDQPSGTQVSGWFKAWTPAASAYAVAARTENDVVAAVNFARRRNLRLVVKGGGHSYQGTSNAADSLLVWTRHMQAITLHDTFVARGCEGRQTPCPAVTVQAGAMWMDVYDAVTTRAGRYVQGGGCATVGVAGLIQSGGFGSFSKGFGTAAGSMLEADVVTADGKLRTVNPRLDPDLFWAIKGGGGGNFGVVIQLTLRTHDLPQFFGAAEGTIEARTDQDFRRLLLRFVDFYAESLFNAHWGESVSIGQNNTLKISMVCQGLDEDSARKIWEPFFTWIKAEGSAFTITDELWVGARPARGWWDAQTRRRNGSKSVVFDDRTTALPTHAWWSGDQEQVGAFLHGYDSIWLPSSLLDPHARVRLTDALMTSSREVGFELHFNKGLAGASPDAIERARDTATNPAVLDAFALAIVAAGGPARYQGLPNITVDDVLAERNAEAIERAMAVLRNIAPAAGSYVSESNYFNPSWRTAFWGSHVRRLTQVKATYDPEGLFFVHHGIGSEQWSPDGFTRLG